MFFIFFFVVWEVWRTGSYWKQTILLWARAVFRRLQNINIFHTIYSIHQGIVYACIFRLHTCVYITHSRIFIYCSFHFQNYYKQRKVFIQAFLKVGGRVRCGSIHTPLLRTIDFLYFAYERKNDATVFPASANYFRRWKSKKYIWIRTYLYKVL